jgi:hypothetical protein
MPRNGVKSLGQHRNIAGEGSSKAFGWIASSYAARLVVVLLSTNNKLN